MILSDKAPMEAFGPVKRIFDDIQNNFKFSIKDRLVIVPEVDMYRIKEDPGIFNQAKTGKYEYQVFFDGEFVCFVNIQEQRKVIWIKIIRALWELKKKGKIHWNKFLYEIEEQERKNKEAKAKAELQKKFDSVKTPEEKLVVEGIKRAMKKKNEKPKGI